MVEFQLDIVTPEKRVYSGEVARFQGSGTEGSFGVLARHAPLLTSLKSGQLAFLDHQGKARRVAASGGFAEVGDNQVTVLAETAEFAEEIDVARAQAARSRAEERLEKKEEGTDVVRAQAALARALNRLKVRGVL